MNFCSISSAKLAYNLYGDVGKPLVIVEGALAGCSAEWWHLARQWSQDFYILVYDRAGYGASTESSLPRSPANIARELKELLDTLGLTNPAVLVGHSMGGLYVNQFARLFPEQIQGIILLDPVSAKNYTFQQRMTKHEYANGGFDKQAGYKLGLFVTRLGLGFMLKLFLQRSLPSYYLNNLSDDAKAYTMRNLTQAKLYRTALDEYAYIVNNQQLSQLEEPADFPQVPVHLICHTPEIIIAEIEKYGRLDHSTAVKLEDLWITLMKEYLDFSSQSKYSQSAKSSHSIHLCDPEIIWQALKNLV